MTQPPHPHFLALRERIRETTSPHARDEYDGYSSWLYGAIGDPEANLMFVCENPSRPGVELAQRKYSHLGIEPSGAVRGPQRLRGALRKTGLLKDNRWRCYVTNVVKELVTQRIGRDCQRPRSSESPACGAKPSSGSSGWCGPGADSDAFRPLIPTEVVH